MSLKGQRFPLALRPFPFKNHFWDFKKYGLVFYRSKKDYSFSYHFNRLLGRVTYFKKQGNVNFTNTGERNLDLNCN
jgi:hypothetical protein